MDKLKEVEKQIGESRAQVANVQQKLSEGIISPEDAAHESVRAFEAIGEVLNN